MAGIRDIVGFHGDSVVELRVALHEAVDDYLATSERLGRDPQKPYSGTLTLRVASELNANVAMQAKAAGKPINQWAAEAVDRAAKTGM